MTVSLCRAFACVAAALAVQAAHAAEPPAAPKVLRVCADPNNLPLSNDKQQGYENKIAELLAAELGWKLEYTWFPQRMGFIRNTLRARIGDTDEYKCDLVMGLPVGFELAATTAPYYRSTYALAYLKGRGLDSVRKPDDLLALDPTLRGKLRLGIFAQTPPADWLLKHGLMEQAVSYTRQSGDPEAYPGEIVEKDLVAGKIDVAFAWGPMVGYFATRPGATPMAVVPFPPDPAIRFDYPIAMGVRFGEREWKARIEDIVTRKRAQIEAILAAYGVPLLDESGQFIPAAKDAAPR